MLGPPACGEGRDGSRNGFRDVTVKTTAGPVTLARPKLRGTSEKFASRLFGAHVTKTNALESLVIASFDRGLSVRDVEATLADAPGDQAAISKSTVSAVCQPAELSASFRKNPRSRSADHRHPLRQGPAHLSDRSCHSKVAGQDTACRLWSRPSSTLRRPKT